VALLGVLFFHANGALPGGYLGVDLFFVLSGYLITSLLLAEHRDTGRIVLSAFLARRARRLLPALLALMPAVALYGRFFTKTAELPALRADALATLGYVANWHTIFAHKSYWELFAAPSPLEHTWSLAIEEQFYLVWPVLVALALRRRGPRSVLVLTSALLTLSMVAMLVLFDPAHTSRVYLGTDTRAAGLLAGAALATVMPPDTAFEATTVRWLDGAGCVAAMGLGVAWWRLAGEDPFLYRGGLWLTEIGVLVLIACAVAGRRSLVARALAFRPLTLVGTISYGVYLWHWPVNVLLTPERVHAGGWLHALQFGVTFAIAIVSYRLLERPIRTRQLSFGPPLYAVPASLGLAILLVVRATNAREGVSSSPLPPPSMPPAEVAAGQAPEPELKVLLLGDSTANSLGWGLRGVREPGLAVELKGQDGCTMLADLCGGPSWAQYVKDMRPSATVVFLGGAFMHGLTVKGQWQQACHHEWDNQFERTLARRLGELKEQDPNVWVVTLPYPLGDWETRAIRAEVDCINASIRKASAASGVEILDLAEQLCPKGVCQRELGNERIRPDGVHFSIEGAADLSRWVLERIESPARLTRQGG
jgi:peptidoglycan/LPS O-acetylase OafA/YrhL